MRTTLTLLLTVSVLLPLPALAEPPATPMDWNDKGIAWRAYEAGLSQAKKEKKPICLVFFTTWCPHCHNYSKVFADAKVVELAKKFVMVRIDRDQARDLSKKYAPDGEYIPRTFFLTPDGELRTELTTGAAQYRYFYDERDPKDLAGAMSRALAGAR